MQLFLDFLPLLAFGIAYKIGDIYTATGTLMISMVLLCAITWFRQRRIGAMLLTSTGLALIAGGVTLLLHNSLFVKWKLTVLDGLFALAFLLAPYISGQTLIERLMGATIKLPATQWRTLNWMWIGFFTFTGSLNVYVLYHYSEATWVNFKMFGTMGLTLVFALLQGIWLATKMPQDDSASSTTTPSDTPGDDASRINRS